MPRQAIWIAVAITMVYWLGQFWGCAAQPDNQNYKVLEQDQEQLDTDVPELQGKADEPQQDVTQVTEATDESTEPTAASAEPVDVEPAADLPEDVTPQPAALPAPRPMPVSDTHASLIGLDRSHWPRIAVMPESGVTRHYGTYHHDVAISDHRFGEVDIHNVFQDPQAKGWSADNLAALVVQPAKFMLDTAVMPLRMVYNRPVYPTTPDNEWVAVTTSDDADTQDAAPASPVEEAPVQVEPVDETVVE